MAKKQSKTKASSGLIEKKDLVWRMDQLSKYMFGDREVVLNELLRQWNEFNNAPDIKEIRETLALQLGEVHKKLIFIDGLDNHFHVSEVTAPAFKGLVVQLATQLAQEYDCQTPSEKALVDLIAGSYGKIFAYNGKLLQVMEKEHAHKVINEFMAITSKEVDRAHRQFISALETLRQIKQPMPVLNFKIKNAFIARNQKLIRKDGKHEISDAD